MLGIGRQSLAAFGRFEGLSLQRLQTMLTTSLLVGPAPTESAGPFGPGTPEESEKSPERVPSQRARGSKKFILARTHEKNHSPTHENFHSRLKVSFSV